MKTCSQCGFHHTDEDQRCIRCGAWLDPIEAADPLAPLDREVLDFEPGAEPGSRYEAPGRAIAGARRRFYVLVDRSRDGLPEDVHRRNPWVAGFLSFLPGVGQLYNHQPKKALWIFGAMLLLTGLVALTFYHPISNWIMIGYLLAFLFAFNDGVITAKRINGDSVAWQHMLGFFFAWVFYISVLTMTVHFVGRMYLVRLRHISADVAAPTLRKGERVAVDVYSYLRREPRVGEIVQYQPPPLKMDNIYTVDQGIENLERNAGKIMAEKNPFYQFMMSRVAGGNAPQHSGMVVIPMNAFERIVAGPGQTFERRDGKFYLDGEEAPAERQPLVTEGLWNEFKLTAPPGHYVILFSYTGSAYDPGSMQPEFDVQAPRLNDPNYALRNWPEACIVPREKIFGRAWFVYNPPPARRMMHRD